MNNTVHGTSSIIADRDYHSTALYTNMGTASVVPSTPSYIEQRERYAVNFYKVCPYCGGHRHIKSALCPGCGASIHGARIIRIKSEI